MNGSVRRRVSLSRDQAIVLASVAAITALAWLCLIDMARAGHPDDLLPATPGISAPGMGDMSGMAMTDMPLSPMPASLPTTAAMWAVMMAGMMLPGALPMILFFTVVQRQQGSRPVAMSALFAAGYLLVWGAFALAAAGLQIALERAALLSPALSLGDVRITALAFVGAGLFEFSALKNRCLAQCRSPFAFVLRHWRRGGWGALCMGAQHGLFCLGCCWVLMLLLFAAGVMNLLWVAALAVLVLLQKLLPGGRAVAIGSGLGMLGIGIALVVR